MVAIVMLSIAVLSGGSAHAATASQQGCTQVDPLLTGWIQALLDGDEREVGREILWLTHLKNHQVQALGSEAGDDEICDQLFQQLHEQYQASLTGAKPEAVAYYYRVGDRYLVYVGASDVTVSLWDIVFSFDLEFNELGAMI